MNNSLRETQWSREKLANPDGYFAIAASTISPSDKRAPLFKFRDPTSMSVPFLQSVYVSVRYVRGCYQVSESLIGRTDDAL